MRAIADQTIQELVGVDYGEPSSCGIGILPMSRAPVEPERASFASWLYRPQATGRAMRDTWPSDKRHAFVGRSLWSPDATLVRTCCDPLNRLVDERIFGWIFEYFFVCVTLLGPGACDFVASSVCEFAPPICIQFLQAIEACYEHTISRSAEVEAERFAVPGR